MVALQTLMAPRPIELHSLNAPGPGGWVPSEPPALDPPETNRLLASLPEADYQRIQPWLTPIAFPTREAVSFLPLLAGQVCFPRSGLISIVVPMADGGAAETGLVGSEGLIGLATALGIESPPVHAVTQIPGGAACLPATLLRRELLAGGALHDLLLHYTGTILIQTAQLAACNALHPTPARCARWLLLAQDRAGQAMLPVTQTMLAQLLGVRRATVSNALASLQHAGLIQLAPGQITIHARTSLEAAACECYDIIAATFARLRGPEV